MEGLLAMFTYIYLNVDECWLKSSMSQQRFELQILLNYAVIPENVVSEGLVVDLNVVEINWVPVTYILVNLITNSIHAWLTNQSGIYKAYQDPPPGTHPNIWFQMKMVISQDRILSNCILIWLCRWCWQNIKYIHPPPITPSFSADTKSTFPVFDNEWLLILSLF